MPKLRAAPKANSDDFAPPGSQEACLHQGMYTARSKLFVVVYDIFFCRVLHKDARRMAREFGLIICRVQGAI